MRKKIPTVTTPDPAYASSLRPVASKERDATQGETIQRASAVASESLGQPPHEKPIAPLVGQKVSERRARPLATPQIPMTRKIDVRVTALERQSNALLGSGVNPAHVIRAALRRAIKSWELQPVYVQPSEERTAKPQTWRVRTTVAVDARALGHIQSTEDPLDVCSKWSLIRGQLEPKVWAEIDAILEERAFAASQHENNQGESTQEAVRFVTPAIEIP